MFCTTRQHQQTLQDVAPSKQPMWNVCCNTASHVPPHMIYRPTKDNACSIEPMAHGYCNLRFRLTISPQTCSAPRGIYTFGICDGKAKRYLSFHYPCAMTQVVHAFLVLGLLIMSGRRIKCGVCATAAEWAPLVGIRLVESAGVSGLCNTCFVLYVDAERVADDTRISEAWPDLCIETHITPSHTI